MGTKIIDDINLCHEHGKICTSFEFFPAKTEAGVDNLLARMEQMTLSLRPTFITLTWRSAFKDESLWLKIGAKAQHDFGINVLLHLTCHLPREVLTRILNNCREAGIKNILALRGDPPIGQDKWQPVEGGLQNATELVKLIREEHGDYFCVAVAGYPEAHTECWNNPDLPPSEQSKQLDMQRLKAKVDAGADFIITQFFYDIEAFLDWRRRCREAGISVPILPGYMIIQNYKGFRKFTTWCKTAVPQQVLDDLEKVQDDDDAVKAYGVRLAIETCQRLLKEGVRSLHYYTMNLSLAVTRVLDGLNLAPKLSHRELPWTAIPARPKEEVRPIFWMNRTTSYLSRTANWDEYPNGRWGDSRSPAYGELTDYYLAYKRPKVDRKQLWGVPKSPQDISRMFVAYLDGNIPQLPWCESSDMTAETSDIKERLRWMNCHGFWTINSQPKANGIPSDDQLYGWGGAGGFVFQKAYVEFFVSPEVFADLKNELDTHPNLTYHALTRSGQEYTNCPPNSVNAVTWGVFPDREILQPTVVDAASFHIWKDEAFELWKKQWQSAYDTSNEGEKQAHDVIQQIYDSYFLVNVVDNAYADDSSDVFSVFENVITKRMDEPQLRARVQELESENALLRAQMMKLRSLYDQTSTEHRDQAKKVSELQAANMQLQQQMRDLEAKSLAASFAALPHTKSR